MSTNLHSSPFLVFLSVLLFSSTVFANSASSAIEVTYSPFLEKRMDRISALDKQREIVFRKYRNEGARITQTPRALLNNADFASPEWANERLIPDIADYSVPTLIEKMMIKGVESAHPEGFDGRVTLDVTKLRVKNFPLSALNSFNSMMEGNIKVYDGDGNLVKEHKVRTTLVPKFTTSRDYNGPDYVYVPTAGDTRVGPIAAEFTAKALEQVFPGFDAPDPIFIKL